MSYSPRTLMFLILMATINSLHAETLGEIYSLARDNDALLRSQKATYLADQEIRKISRAGLLPHISANGSWSETDQDDNLLLGDFKTESESYDVTVDQPLFNLENWYGYKQGRHLSNKAEVQYETDKQDLIIRVVDAYTNVLRAVDNYNTAKAEQAAIGRQLEQTRQRFEVGLIAITDVHESQASFDNAVVNTVNALGEVGIAFESLSVLTGQPIMAIAPLVEDFQAIPPVPESREEWANMALINNTSLKASEFGMKAAKQNAKSKTAAHYPTISGRYQYQNNDTDFDPGGFGGTDQEGDVYSINLKIPLFAGGINSAKRRQAWQQYNASLEMHNNTKRNIVQNARSLHLTVNTDVARVKAQKQAIISAESALEATRAGYDAGTRNIVDVLNAERLLYQSQRAWHNSRYQYIRNLVQLKKVAGILNNEDVMVFSEHTDSDKQILRSTFEY